MILQQYLRTLDASERRDYAERVGTSPAYLIQLAGGHRKASPPMARRLCAESGNKVTLAELRPDIWSEVA